MSSTRVTSDSSLKQWKPKRSRPFLTVYLTLPACERLADAVQSRVVARVRVARAQLADGDDVAAGDDFRRLGDRQTLGLQAFRQRGREAHGVRLDALGADLEQLAERCVDGDDARPVVVAGLEAPRVGRQPDRCGPRSPTRGPLPRSML